MQKINANTPIKPCPFCGGTAKFTNCFKGKDGVVSCQNLWCGALQWDKTEFDAIRKWNKRAYEQ